MEDPPQLIQPLNNLTNYRNARSHATVLRGYAGRPVGDPKHVPHDEADRADARAIQLANYVEFGDLPKPAPNTLDMILQTLNRLNQLPAQIDAMDARLTARLDQVDARLTQVEGRLTQVEGGLTRVEGGLTQVEERLTRVEERLNSVETSARQTHLASLRALNGGRGDGTLIPYEIIPFRDGKMPTDNEFQIARHPYPLVRTFYAITELTSAQLNRYLTQYGVDNIPGNDQERRVRLCEILGISAHFTKVGGAL